MRSILWLFDTVLAIYMFVVIAYVIMSLLINFNIVNAHQPVVSSIFNVLYRLVEPMLWTVRNTLGRFLPNISGIDLAPLVLLLLLTFARLFAAEVLSVFKVI